MPLPKPKQDENRAEFIKRCVSNENVQNESSDNDQAVAICQSLWEQSEEKSMNVNEQLLKALAARGQKSEPFAYGIHRADAYVRNLQNLIGLDRCYRHASTNSISFTDIMEKAAKTLTYSNPEMVLEEKGKLDLPESVELPKNTLMVFRHILTTNRKDRDGDVLHPNGFDVDPNMLLLFQHIHTMPIGKMLAEVDHNTKRLSLISCIVDINELCHDSAVMIDNKMGRFSHGFRAMEFTEIKDKESLGEGPGGFDITKGEIMEESLVSVAANKDAENEEVMLSLVEGGKLTSALLKEVGKGIREQRAVSVPVSLDLRVTVNGQEVDDENESGDRGEEESKGSPGTPKETDDVEEKKKETPVAEVKEISEEVGDTSKKEEVMKIEEKAGRTLSKANAAKIGDAKEDVDEAAKAEGVARPVKALLRQASGKLGSVLASLGSDEEPKDKPSKEAEPTVKQAMAMVLSLGSIEDLKIMASHIKGLEKAKVASERARKFRNFKRKR